MELKKQIQALNPKTPDTLANGLQLQVYLTMDWDSKDQFKPLIWELPEIVAIGLFHISQCQHNISTVSIILHSTVYMIYEVHLSIQNKKYFYMNYE